MTPQQVVGFWRDAGPPKWFAKSDAFDGEIRDRFEAAHHAAAAGAHDDWAASAEGALALLILLDQFPRNLFRGSGHAFATDGKALAIARQALAADFDRTTDEALRPFFYLPFEHSEDLADQDEGIARSKAVGIDDDTLKWAILHRDVVARFGRYPHRNAALGRTTTAQEQAFLDGGGFAG